MAKQKTVALRLDPKIIAMAKDCAGDYGDITYNELIKRVFISFLRRKGYKDPCLRKRVITDDEKIIVR